MDNTTLALFVHELRNQCIYTEAAFRVFNQSLQEGASAGAFFAGQSILLSASQIGAILWPSRARAKTRGETLRSALNLGESHPLADRRLTNLWDLGDEKLEEWIFDTKGEQVIFDHLGPVPAAGDTSLPDLNLYRLYDPTTQVFYFRGNGFKLQAIADAISDVFKRVTALHRQLLPDQYRPSPSAAGDTQPQQPVSSSPTTDATTTDLEDETSGLAEASVEPPTGESAVPSETKTDEAKISGRSGRKSPAKKTEATTKKRAAAKKPSRPTKTTKAKTAQTAKSKPKTTKRKTAKKS